MNKLIVSLSLILCLLSCQDEPGTPRPRAYPRVEYPEHTYQTFNEAACPFTFQFPKYAEVKMKADQPCWFDLSMPVFNARLYCSYIPVKNRAEFDGLVKDTYTMARKINERANYMEESQIRNAQGVPGLALKWTGPAASPLHFFLSDTTHHFFKAALYFEAEVKPDSLAPISRFVEDDVNRMIQSFTWNKGG